MRQLRRPLLFVALILTLLGTSQAAFAFPPLNRPWCGVTVQGFGRTPAEADSNLQDALDAYVVFRSTYVDSGCLEMEIPDPQPNDPFHTITETSCWKTVRICGMKKALTFAG